MGKWEIFWCFYRRYDFQIGATSKYPSLVRTGGARTGYGKFLFFMTMYVFINMCVIHIYKYGD